MKRVAAFGLVILTAEILQSAGLSRVALFGVAPDLTILAICVLAVTEGPSVGAATGFGGGLLRDLQLETPAGLTALSFLVAGYLIGAVRPYVQQQSILLPVASVGVGSLVAGVLLLLFASLFGVQPDALGRVLRVVLLTTVYNVLLTPFIYPVVSRVAVRYPRDRIYRW